MNKSIYLITGVLALSISGVAFSQDQNRGNRMSEMDTDGNGTVEKSEFSAMLDKRFAQTDTNGGGITLEEYQAKSAADREARNAQRDEKREQKKAMRAGKAEERATKRAERSKERFASMDADGNGTISSEEYKAAGEKMFDRMDRNDDGILNDRRGRGRGDRGPRGPKGPRGNKS